MKKWLMVFAENSNEEKEALTIKSTDLFLQDG